MKKISLSIITTFVSLLPIYGYFIAYSYESAYLSAFEIPTSLMQINLNTVILATISVITLFGIIFVFAVLASPLLNKFRKNLFLYPLLLLFLVFGLVSLFLWMLNTENMFLLPIIFVICSGLIFTIDFLFPFITHRTFKNYAALVIKERSSTTSKYKLTINLKPINSNIKIVIVAILLLFSSYLLSNTVGNSTALYGSQIYYVFANKDKNYALIRNYSDYRLAIRYKNNTIIPGEVYVFNKQELYLNKSRLSLPKNIRDDDKSQKFNKFILESFQFAREKIPSVLYNIYINLLETYLTFNILK